MTHWLFAKKPSNNLFSQLSSSVSFITRSKQCQITRPTAFSLFFVGPPCRAVGTCGEGQGVSIAPHSPGFGWNIIKTVSFKTPWLISRSLPHGFSSLPTALQWCLLIILLKNLSFFFLIVCDIYIFQKYYVFDLSNRYFMTKKQESSCKVLLGQRKFNLHRITETAPF